MAIAGVMPARPPATWRRPALWILGWLLLALPVARARLAEGALARHLPGQALLLEPHQAQALTTLATALQLGGRQQQATGLARTALADEPMNVAALRTIGLAREQAGDKAGATRIMMLAARLGWRDPFLQLWLLRSYAQQGRYLAALQRADALARTNHLQQVTFPVFMAYLGDPRTALALAREMADRPFWRGIFFYHLLDLPAEQMPNVARFVVDLARVGSPITPAERDIYLTRLIQLGQGATALTYWQADQHARGTSAAGVPWDGGFEHVPPRGAPVSPFEWQLAANSAGIADIAPGAHGQQLVVSPGHDFSGTAIAQTLALSPGRYRITAQVSGDAAGAGLRWTVRCVPGQDELPVDTGLTGTGFAGAAFAVPAGCPVQSLSIDIGGGDAASGQVTVDDVAVRRIG